MSKFTNELRNLVASNRLDEMIRRLMDSLTECERVVGSGNQAVKEIRNMAIQYSARLNDIKTREANQTLSHTEAQTSHSRILTAFLNLIDDFYKYPDYLNYLEDVEEDEAWEEAKRIDEIEAYQDFFERYPDGKYKDETRAIIEEVKELERKNREEIQRRVQEERDRREREEELEEEKKRQEQENQRLRDEAALKEQERLRIEREKRLQEQREKEEKAQENKILEEARIAKDKKDALEQERIRLAAEEQELADKRQQIEAERQRLNAEKEEQDRIEEDKVDADEGGTNEHSGSDLENEKQSADFEKKNVYPHGQDTVAQEKGIRAWITRRDDAFCLAFVLFFLSLYFATFIPMSVFYEGPASAILLTIISSVISIPVLMIKNGDGKVIVAGWLGLLNTLFTYILLIVGIPGKSFWFLLGAYLLLTAVMGFLSWNEAMKKSSIKAKY